MNFCSNLPDVLLQSTLAAALLCVPGLSHATDAKGELHVHAQGFDDETGHAVAKLFKPGEDVLSHGTVLAKAEIHGGEANLVFTDVADGDYAVVVFHDKNDNGVIDHNMVGMPVEQLGFSNGFALSMFSGMPSFQKLKFNYAAPGKTVEITVK